MLIIQFSTALQPVKPLSPQPSIRLESQRNLATIVTTTLHSGPRPLIFSYASNIGFIDFDSARKIVAIGTYHCSTQFMHPDPCSFVITKTKNTLQSKSAGSILLARCITDSDSKQQCSQWLVCFVRQFPTIDVRANQIATYR